MVRGADTLYEQVLVLRCQTGDNDAFQELLDRYHPRIAYYVRRLLGDRDRTCDLLQEVWLEVFRAIPRLKRPEAFNLWIHRIARNLACQQLRREKRSLQLSCDMVDPPALEEEPRFTAADVSRILPSLERISPPLGEVLVLRFLEGMSYEQIAEVVGCPLGTVRSRIHYAKIALRREMEASS